MEVPNRHGDTRLSSAVLLSPNRYSYVLGKETFLMLWPGDRDRGKEDLLGELEGFSEYMTNHGCES